MALRIFSSGLAILALITANLNADDNAVFNQLFGGQAASQPDALDPKQPRAELIRNLAAISREITAAQSIDPLTIPVPLESIFPYVIADLEALPATERLYTRYLDLTGVYPQERAQLYSVVSVALNSLSWANQIVQPQVVSGTQGRLLRFNIIDYCRDGDDVTHWAAAWEKMTSHDPYYRQPWVDEATAYTATALAGSAGCVVRADWFVFYSMKQDNPKTADVVEGFYSDFLNLPGTEEELLALLRVRLDEARELGTDRRALVVQSGTDSDAAPVAFNNRKVNRAPAILTPHGGYFYHTQDFDTSRGSDNVFSDPLDDDKDGGEYIWSMPNFLQGYYLTAKVVDANGKAVLKNGKPQFSQIDEVPINIAASRFNHRRVKYDSCTHCHINGINTYKDELQQTLLRFSEPGGAVQLTETKIGAILEARQLFSRDQQGIVLADQLNYTMAVEKASGMKAAAFADAWRRVMDNYESALSPKRSAWEFGARDIQSYLADKVVSTTQGALLLLVKAGPDDKVIHRDTFEAEFANGKLLATIKDNIARSSGHKIAVPVPATVISEVGSWRIRNYPTARAKGNTLPYPADVRGLLSAAEIIAMIQKGSVDAATELQNGAQDWVRADQQFPTYFEVVQ